MKAVIFDIYGTLLQSDAGDLDETLSKEKQMLKALSLVKEKHGLSFDEKTILDKYIAEIRKVHDKKKEKGIVYPEIIIEDIWSTLIPSKDSKQIAWDFYNYCSERKLYSNTKKIISYLQKKVPLGIISNAQFYTIIDLEKLLDASLDIYFDKNLCFWSYKVGYSKPNPGSFIALKEKLERMGISPEETLFVGNHAVKDIQTAKSQGFKTCLFVSTEAVLDENIQADYTIYDLLDLRNIV